MYRSIYTELEIEAEKVAISNRRIMKIIKARKGTAFTRCINNYLQDLSSNCYHKERMEYKIVGNPLGDYQKED